MRVRGGRGRVHEGAAMAAVVGARSVPLGEKARRKAGRTEVERMGSRLVRAGIEGADLGVVEASEVVRPRPGRGVWVPSS